ncbi:MAG: lysophospholipase [Cyanobacteriota bacterium]
MKKTITIFLLLLITSCTASLQDYKNKPEDNSSIVSKLKNGKEYIHKTGFFNSIDKIELFEQSWTPKEESKTVLIIVHGLKDHSSRYEDFAKKMVEKGISVYSYDLRGHGKSKGYKVWIDSFNQYIDDLGLFYAKVKQKEGNKKMFIMGHSMGGAITTLFAMSKKPEIEGVILSAPALKAGKDISEIKIGLVNFLSGAFPYLGLLELDDNSFSRDKNAVEDMKKDPLIYHSNGPARTASELIKALERINTNMIDFNYNFITLHGTDDKITNIEGSEDLYKKAKSKNKKFLSYKDSYHDLLHEREKDKVFDDIYSWIKN